MVDYHNYFTTVHLLMNTGVAYWLRQQLHKCALQAQHSGRILHAKYVNYVLYAHPPLQRVSKMHRPWAYNTYSTVLYPLSIYTVMSYAVDYRCQHMCCETVLPTIREWQKNNDEMGTTKLQTAESALQNVIQRVRYILPLNKNYHPPIHVKHHNMNLHGVFCFSRSSHMILY